MAWMLSGQPPTPADALRRIKAICKALPDPYAASITVLVTHPCVPRELLAATILTFRDDLAAYSKEDMATMLVAAWNGGKSGFDAVMRTRANAPKRSASMSWVKE
ncbi:hypothetical protein AACH06_28640 [Ideonella sp. DXS29W]|uniref:Uncharacterized protein n=1 Tax=Ideonella lacteola TaxID=2984193 RepID=A0ABU9BYG1_9BURK